MIVTPSKGAYFASALRTLLAAVLSPMSLIAAGRASFLAVLLVTAVTATAPAAIEMQPSSLTIDAAMNEAVTLQVEVVSEADLGEIDLKAEGLRIQREVKRLAPNRTAFVIEPDTSRSGRVDGVVAVIRKDGSILCQSEVHGEVRPHIRVTPPRVFLGSLEYGSTTTRTYEKRFQMSFAGDWKVTGVDGGGIAGLKHFLTTTDGSSKELRITFSEPSLKDGYAFGAFIRKTLRVETDRPEQPEVLIPITAILSLNGTARDFHAFVFHENTRWQGIWPTPNIAAAVLGPVILLLMGYGCLLWRATSRRPLLSCGMAVVLLAVAFGGTVLLVKSYSRGGWVSFGIGLAAMLVLMKVRRRELILCGLICTAIAGLFPSAVQRAGSVVNLADDHSIRNRLLVWRGALEMIIDHPVTGVGAGRFGKVFEDYYQKPWHNSSYSTAVNDYLTFAAELGFLPVLLVMITGILAGAAVLHLAARHQDNWVYPIFCALVCLCGSSLFSSVAFVREVRALAFTCQFFLLAYCAFRIRFLRQGCGPVCENFWAPPRRSALVACGLVVGILGLALGWTHFSRLARPLLRETSTSGVEAPSLTYIPVNALCRGTVFYLAEDDQPLASVGRFVLRPLAENGWRATSLLLPRYDQDATATVIKLLRDCTGPCIILAEGSRARVADAAAEGVVGERPRLVLISPILSSALGECDRSRVQDSHEPPMATLSAKEWAALKADVPNFGKAVSAILERRTFSPEPFKAVEHMTMTAKQSKSTQP